ncbi:leucine-rich repeat domain-containing protein [Sorangium sp. So ce204]|uniref:leucine-rich repeat domain-containing protein n=1 Tax=Sorangium sp. So ce204 TaxID=3133288 RepID=UPI003F5ED72C
MESGTWNVNRQEALEKLRGVTVLNGRLNIGGEVSDLSPLACLTRISGHLVISDTWLLSSLDGLDSLSVVGAQLEVARNASLLRLGKLPNLQQVKGLIEIRENPILESVAGVGLNAHEVHVIDNNQLDALSGFERFEEGVLLIEGNDNLVSLDGLQGLRRGTLRLVDNDALQFLPGVENFEEGELWIEGNDGLWSLRGLVSLRHGQISVIDNDALISLDGLEAVEELDVLDISGNDGLRELNSVSRLSTVQNLVLAENPQLTSLYGLDQLRHAGSISIARNERLRHLVGLGGLETVDGLIITGNSSMGTLTGMFSLRGVQYAVIESNPELVIADALAHLGSDSSEVQSIYFTSNPKLTEIDLGGLTRLRELVITDCGSLADLSDLAGVTELSVLSLGHNAGLMSLAGVEQISDLFLLAIANNPRLTDLRHLSGLRNVRNGIEIAANPALTSLDGLGSLSEGDGVTDVVRLEGNESLVDIDALRGLVRVSQLVIQDNDALLGLTGLEGLADLDSLIVEGNRSLATLRGLGARTVNGWIEIMGNESLPSCDVEAFVERLDWVPDSVRAEDNGTGTCSP